MGNITSDLLIWTPDEYDTAEPDSYLATMAQSLEDGVGNRLRTQEVAVGLKAGFTSAPTLSSAMPVAAVTVNTANGSFAQGLTIAAGIVTVVSPGMYLVSGSVGVQNISGHTAEIQLRKGSTILAIDSQKSDVNYFQAAKATTVVNCVAGDTLSMRIGDALGGATVASNLALTHFTVAMIQAVPV